MSPGDFLITAVILAGAAYLLYRSLWKNQGACHGCASGGCRSRPRVPGELVRLGARRPSAGDGPASGPGG